MHNWIDVLAAQHAHDGDCFFQVCVTEEGAEGVVLVRVQGPRLINVDHVNDVRGLPWLAWLAIQSVFPLLGWDRGVEFVWIGERMFGDVGWLLVLPAPKHRCVADHQQRVGNRQTVAISPTCRFGPPSGRSARDAVTREA